MIPMLTESILCINIIRQTHSSYTRAHSGHTRAGLEVPRACGGLRKYLPSSNTTLIYIAASSSGHTLVSYGKAPDWAHSVKRDFENREGNGFNFVYTNNCLLVDLGLKYAVPGSRYCVSVVPTNEVMPIQVYFLSRVKSLSL